MQEQKVVYISTWGDPAGWQNAKYEKKDGTVSPDGYTSLATYDKFDKLILIVQDSILALQFSSWIKDRNEYRNKDVDACIKQLNSEGQLINRILSSLNSGSYGDYLKAVNDYVSCLIQKIKENIEKEKKEEKNTKNDKKEDDSVIILPGIGKFSGNLMGTKVTCDCGRLNGGGEKYIPLSYIESLLAYNIYKKIENLKEDYTVILDITHGINYLSSLTLEVVKELTSLLNLNMKVIDYIPTYTPTDTNQGSRIFTYNEFTPLSNTKFDVNKIRVNSIDKNHVKALILSLQMGAILPILYVCKKYNGGETSYDEIFKKKTQIQKDDKSQNNNSDINFSIVVDSIKELKSSDIVWSDIILDYVCEKIQNIKDQNNFYSLDDIEGLLKSLSNFFSETTINVIETEIEKIKKSNYIKDKEEKTLYEVRTGNKPKSNMCKSDSEEKKKGKNHSNRRNFTAHAGFLDEIVKVKKENGKFFVKYCLEEGDKCYDVLKDVYGPDVGQLLVDLINGGQAQSQGINNSHRPK